MDLTKLYCDTDDFVKSLPPRLPEKRHKRGPERRMSDAEILTVAIFYHASKFRNFKAYYRCLQTYYQKAFPELYSYNRFVELMPSYIALLCLYLNSRKGKVTGTGFIDSTSIKVCHNVRSKRNRVFKGIARRGKTSMGWFFGFKLHLVVNERGDILSFAVTAGNVDDRAPVKKLCRGFSGNLYGDKGYIGKKLFEALFSRGVRLVTNVRSNMQNRLMHTHDKLMLRKRFIIETINDQLKNVSDIEHTRHRSPSNFLVNLLAGLVAYTWQDKRPSIRATRMELAMY